MKSLPASKAGFSAYVPTLIFVLVFLSLWFSPCPMGLTPKAWQLFAIFFSAIFAIILKILPMPSLAFLAITTVTITQTLSIHDALNKFSSNIVWLIVAAFLLAKGFIKSGLGSRIAYCFVFLFGRSTLGLGYSLAFTEFLLAPFIPSNTARGAGVVYPIVIAVSEEYQSHAKNLSARKIGAYLIQIAFHTNIITSAMFLTAMAANPIIVSIASEMQVEINWLSWFKASSLPGLLSLIIVPALLYVIYPPLVRKTPKARELARFKLQKMGKITRNEWIMMGVFVMLLTLWVLGGSWGVDATATAFLGVTILLFSGVLTSNDILGEKNAWNTFLWLATLLMLTGELNKLGFVAWLVDHMKNAVIGLSWQMALFAIVLCYFFSHYFFASKTARVSALYGAFCLTAIAAGAPAPLVAYLFAFLSSLSACLTHYSTGAGPVFFGAEYVSFGAWWRIGIVVALTHLLIWTAVGPLWWKYLELF